MDIILSGSLPFSFIFQFITTVYLLLANKIYDLNWLIVVPLCEQFLNY